MKKQKTKNGDAQKKRSSRETRGCWSQGLCINFLSYLLTNLLK